MDKSKGFKKGLEMLFRPLASFCLRRGVKIQEALEAFKKALIYEAEQDLRERAEKITDSKLSVMTGIHRRDITRLYHEGSEKSGQITLLGKVIGAWQLNKKYLDSRGRPRALTCNGSDSEFSHLVSSISNDVKPSTVLFELERSALIKNIDGKITLLGEAFTPSGNIESNFAILSSDLNDIISAVEENTYSKNQDKNLHAKTEFDNIDISELPRIKRWLLDKGAKYHQEAREFLAKFDFDYSPERARKSSASGRIVFGTFAFTSDKVKKSEEGNK